MKKNIFIFLAFASLLLPSQIFASNYYWVGGTGNYSDVSHWATTSGGTTFQIVPPTIYDDVFFDANSFLTTNDTMYFDIDYSGAHFFTIAGVLNTPTFADGPATLRIDIQGNFSIASNINWISSCDLAFIPLAPDSSLSIQTNTVYLPNHLLIDGDASNSVILLDNLACYGIEMDNGNFISNNHDLSCTYSYTSYSTTLYLGTSTVTSDYIMDFLGTATFFSDSATFISPNFNVNTGIFGLHFGTIIAPYVSIEGCYIKVAQTGVISGMGNVIELFIDDSASTDYAISTLGANQIAKVITGHYALFNGNTIIDTLIFTEPGIDMGIDDTLTITGEMVMINTPAKPGIIRPFNDSCYISKASGIVCMDFITMHDVHAIGGAQFFAGSNSIDQGNTNPGWQFTGCVTTGGVWPGDANFDLTVNNLDILAIGLANGETGPVRGGASYSWVEQPVADWSNSFASGVNMKHADCDGNGTVDASDTTAVSVNYGFHHPAARLIEPELNPNSNSFLIIDVSPDTVGPSTPVHINVDLGIDSIYGIAFSVFYDPILINSNSLIPDFSNSWLGINGVNMIGFAKADPVAGRIDFALTRTDHTDAFAGAGHLISFDLITADNIPFASTLTMEANDVSGIYLAQNYEVITGSTDSTFVDSTVSVHQQAHLFMHLNANIVNNQLNLSYYCFQNTDLNLMLTDVTGRVLMKQELPARTGINNNEIQVGKLAKGIYLVTLNGQTLKVVRE